MNARLFALLTLAIAGCSAPPGVSAPTVAQDDAAVSPAEAGTPDAAPPERDAAPAPDAAADADADADAAAPPFVGYDPCPLRGQPCVVMPLGDSITYGIGSSSGGGYRVPLLRRARAAGQSITFVGYETSGPDTLDGQPFPTSNEGHVGYTIDDAPSIDRTGISSFVVASLQLHRPNVVLLMIGTNDVNLNNDVANAPARLAHLVDTIVATSPDALLVVAEIIPTADEATNAAVRAYDAAIPGIVSARQQAGKHVALVDMYAVFPDPAAMLADALHPNDTGYAAMSDVWYAAIGGALH